MRMSSCRSDQKTLVYVVLEGTCRLVWRIISSLQHKYRVATVKPPRNSVYILLNLQQKMCFAMNVYSHQGYIFGNQHNKETLLMSVSAKSQSVDTEHYDKKFTANIFQLFCANISTWTNYGLIRLLWFCLGSHSTWFRFGKHHGLGLILKNSAVT